MSKLSYVLMVRQPGYGSQGAYLAYQFAQCLLKKGHQIKQVFFYQDGVSNGNGLVEPASDEFCLQKAWQTLAEQHQISLHLCISAAHRRGIVETNLAPCFHLAGLGEFSQAMLQADRVLTV